jgi:gluconate 2-dehydrogenase subunit 3-like protein
VSQDLTRREALQVLGAVPLLVAGLSPQTINRATLAAQQARAAGTAFAPRFFTLHELATASRLADLIIPRDERSGSATDAGVPEFIDFILSEYEDMQITFRGGLAWMDREAYRRYGKNFVDLADAETRRILDDIAFPKKAGAALSHGVHFFTRFRDLTASGFFSSKMGVEDLRYIGNEFVTEWKGCPPEALTKLGVKY